MHRACNIKVSDATVIKKQALPSKVYAGKDWKGKNFFARISVPMLIFYQYLQESQSDESIDESCLAEEDVDEEIEEEDQDV